MTTKTPASSALSPALPLALSLALLGGCANLVDGAPQARSATVQRSAHGVVHIHAPDLETMAYAMAYAHAQDNLCLTADHFVTVRGERSRHFGAAASGGFGLRWLPNEQIDFFVAAVLDDAELARQAAMQGPQAQALERGYVAGYNRFLAERPAAAGGLHAQCDGQPWLQPMTVADYRRANALFTRLLGGAGAFAEAMLSATPPAGALAAAAPEPAVDLADAGRLMRELGVFDAADRGPGSNAWAFGSRSTAGGRGMLLGNPHFPWTGVNRFWQVQLTVPGVMDVMGASIGHFPFVAIGFNRDVAWSHTTSTGKRFTLHELTLQPGEVTRYLVDGRPEPMQPRELRITVKAADGTLAVKTQTLWSTRWGPVVVQPRAGLNWTARRAYALQDAMAGDHLRSLDTYLGLATARSVHDVQAAVARLGTTFNNTVAADRHGQVLYADSSSVPDVDAAMLQRCAPGPQAAGLLASAGLVVLDGSRADCQWRQDPASPRPGLTPLERLPVALRQDWVHNANDSHVYTHPDQRFAGISPLVGDDTVRSRRTLSGLRELPQLLARGPVTLQGIQQQLFANRNLMADIVLPDLLTACAGPAVPGDDAREACAVLRQWDRSSNAESRGAHLFREFVRELRNPPGLFRVPLDRARLADTPSGLNLADAERAGAVWAALQTAVRRLRAAQLALDAPLGSVQRPATTPEPIALHGGEGFEGVLNYLHGRRRPGLSAGGYAIDYGTSYVQTVGFDERGPVAYALLTYGQSADPASPHATDQLRLYSAKQWPRLPFHADEVAQARVGPVMRLSRP